MKTMLLILTALGFSAVVAFAYPTIGAEDTLWTKTFYPFEINAVCMHPDGNTIVVSYSNFTHLMQVDATNGDSIGVFTHELSSAVYRSIDISPDGKYLIAGDWSRRSFLWDYQTKELLKIFPDTYMIVKFGGNEKKVFLGGKNGSSYYVSAYDIEKDSIVYNHETPTNNNSNFNVTASPDGRYFAYSYSSYNGDGSSIYLLDANSFNRLNPIFPRHMVVTSIAFSANSKWFGFSDYGGRSYIYDCQKLILENNKEVKFTYKSNYPRFTDDEKYVFEIYQHPTLLINIETKDTVLSIPNWINDYAKRQSITNNLLLQCFHTIIMYNSNWHYLDVSETPESTFITELYYSNNSLFYSTFGIESFNSFVITDATGAVVFSNSLLPISGSIPLNLTSGIYFLTINNEFSKKFIVVR